MDPKSVVSKQKCIDYSEKMTFNGNFSIQSYTVVSRQKIYRLQRKVTVYGHFSI